MLPVRKARPSLGSVASEPPEASVAAVAVVPAPVVRSCRRGGRRVTGHSEPADWPRASSNEQARSFEGGTCLTADAWPIEAPSRASFTGNCPGGDTGSEPLRLRLVNEEARDGFGRWSAGMRMWEARIAAERSRLDPPAWPFPFRGVSGDELRRSSFGPAWSQRRPSAAQGEASPQRKALFPGPCRNGDPSRAASLPLLMQCLCNPVLALKRRFRGMLMS